MDSLYSKLVRKPGYQRDVQQRMGLMPSQRAVPNTRDIARFHARGMAREELAGEQHQTGLGFRKKAHADETALGREKLDMSRGQGRLATGLGVANLGLQTFAGILQIRDANRQAQLFGEMAATYRQAGNMKGANQATFMSFLVGGG